MSRPLRFTSAIVLALLASPTAFAEEILPGAQSQPQSQAQAQGGERASQLSPEQATLTLADAEAWALQHHPALARAESLVRAARGEFQQAGRLPNPHVGYSGQQLGSRGLAEQEGVLIRQEIVRGEKRRLDRAIASKEVVSAMQALAVQEQRVLTDVRTHYFAALVARRSMEVSDLLVTISEQSLATATRLVASGELARLDLLQAETILEEDRLQAGQARLKFDAAWRSLAAVLGQPQLAPMTLQADLEAAAEPLAFEEVLATLRSTSPEMAQARAEVERARCAYARTRVETQPNLSVEGLVNVRDNGIGGTSDGSLVLTAPLPLWNRHNGAIARAHHEFHAAEQALAQLELALQQRLAPVFERYENARQQVARYQTKIMPATRETYALTGQMLASGEIAFDRLLLTQRQNARTSLAYLDHLLTLRVAEAELAGLLLSGSLEVR